jgi:charged multivesicular body protein 2A
MVALNGQVNLPQLQKVMMEFQKQSEMMDMKQEVVGDAIDDAMNTEEDAEESEAVVNSVLDELGIQMTEGLVDAPGMCHIKLIK